VAELGLLFGGVAPLGLVVGDAEDHRLEDQRRAVRPLVIKHQVHGRDGDRDAIDDKSGALDVTVAPITAMASLVPTCSPRRLLYKSDPR